MKIGLLLFAMLATCLAIDPAYANSDRVSGIVVDQDGKPVAGAKVIFEESEHVLYVPIPNGPTWKSKAELQDTTRDDGSFEVNFTKDTLSLMAVEKKGYIAEHGITRMRWRRRIASQAATPYKAQICLFDIANVAQGDIINYNTEQFRFATSGNDYYVNMSSGKVSEKYSDNADLAFSVKEVGKSTYLFTIRALTGGVWGSGNEMPYAPKDGYVKGFSTIYELEGGNYRFQYAFFAKTQGGKHYSRVIVDVTKKKQTIQFYYALNPTGSRFLFVPQGTDDEGFHGPPRHPNEWWQVNSQYIMLNGELPWWRTQQFGLYPILPVETFAELAKHEDGQTINYVARQIYAPDQVLEDLSRSPVSNHRWDVAQNRALPQAILKRLTTDTHESVRREANETMARQLSIRAFLESKGYYRAEAE